MIQHQIMLNFIDGLMVSVLGSDVIVLGLESQSGKTKNMYFTASLLSLQHQEVRAKTDWVGIRMICLSRATSTRRL